MPFTTSGTENLMRWDRSSSGFLEVWYATVNHAETGAGVWIRYTITAPDHDDPYCELWAVRFDPDGKSTVALRNRFDIDLLAPGGGRDDGAIVRIGDAWLSETHLDGSVRDVEHQISWSLDIEPAERCFQHFPARLRKRSERKYSALCSPNLSVPFTGEVRVDDEVITFTGEHGCQTHRWGVRQAQSWSWAHCSNFAQGERAVFEAVAGRTSLGPIPVPTMTFVYLSFRGEDLAFNDLKWALRAKGAYEMPTWAFSARNEEWKIVGAARASIDRFVQVKYDDPDGSSHFCANSEVADLALEIYRLESGKWLHVASLSSLKGAHLEFGRKDPFAEMPVSL